MRGNPKFGLNYFVSCRDLQMEVTNFQPCREWYGFFFRKLLFGNNFSNTLQCYVIVMSYQVIIGK